MRAVNTHSHLQKVIYPLSLGDVQLDVGSLLEDRVSAVGVHEVGNLLWRDVEVGRHWARPCLRHPAQSLQSVRGQLGHKGHLIQVTHVGLDEVLPEFARPGAVEFELFAYLFDVGIGWDFFD